MVKQILLITIILLYNDLLLNSNLTLLLQSTQRRVHSTHTVQQTVTYLPGFLFYLYFLFYTQQS